MRSFVFLLAVLCLVSFRMIGSVSANERSVSQAAEHFNIIYPEGLLELDPHQANTVLTAQLHTALYEGLVTLDPRTLLPEPALAEDWTISKDEKVYTFRIRKGVFFSDGTPLDAYSFYRSFLRLIDPNIPKEYAYLLDGVKNVARYRLDKEGSISDLGLRVLSPRVFEITLEYPIPYFLSLLAHRAFVPISAYQLPVMWKDYSRIAYSGPYVVSRYSADSMHLVKNPFYWDKDNVNIPELNITISNDALQNTVMFDNNKSDWVLGPFDPKSLKKRSALKINPSFSTQFFYFADDHPAFQDVRVREALFLLIPWQELRNLYSTPALGLVPTLPKSLGYSSFQGFKTDKKRALKLLARAGYPKGRGLPELVVVTSYIHDNAAKTIASAWLQLDTTVRVFVPEGDYFDYLDHNRPTLAAYGWVADYLDPIAFLSLFASTNPLNKSIYKDPVYDRFLFSSNLRKNKSRMRILSDAESTLLNSFIVVPINHPPSSGLIDLTIIRGWYENPLDIHPFKYLSFGVNEDIRKSMIGRFISYGKS